MDEYNVQISIEAQNDALAIFEYIFSKLENPKAAEKIYGALVEKCLKLKKFPKASTVRFKLDGKDFRFAHYRKYLIVYYVDEKEHTVKIRNIVYAKKDYRTFSQKPGFML